MKRKLIIPIALLLATTVSCDELSQTVATANDVLNGGNSEEGNKLTNDEVIKGLKEALTVGTKTSSATASKEDGYFKNTRLFIPFPEEAIKVKEKVEDLGLKSQVDKFVLTMNRAAEESAKEAVPIFVDAVTSMSIADGFNILKGADNAATVYLKDKTTTQLTQKFSPIVQKAIDKVGVTKQWNPIITKYNGIMKLTGGDQLNPDLNAYITERAIKGLFVLIEDEEKKIRKDPIARVSDILKKVFGSLDK
jgi:hypothetical protein